MVTVALLAILLQGSLVDIARESRGRPVRGRVFTNADVVRNSSASEVLRLTGAYRVLDMVAGGFIQSLSPEARHAATESFDVVKLAPILERRFAAEIDGASLAEVTRWFQTPLAIRIVAAESQGRVVAERLSIPEERTRLLADLERELQGTERLTDTLARMMKAMIDAMLAGNPEFEKDRAPFLLGMDEGFRKSATPHVRQVTMAGYINAYRSLSDADLAEYIHFLKTPAAKNLNRALWLGLQEATESGAAQTGRRSAALLTALTGAK